MSKLSQNSLDYEAFVDDLEGPETEIGEVPVESQGGAGKLLREREKERERERAEEDRKAAEDARRMAKEAIEERQGREKVTEWREVVVDKNGQPRQAGAGQAEGQFIKNFKMAAEEDLYVFSKGVMGRRYLTKELHLPLCQGLQKVPPFRKMRLMPRDHAKTSVVGHCLPVHILIQSKEKNLYFPGMEGTENRIMLTGETQPRAKGNLRVIETAFESNKVLRALWPEKCWEKPKAQAKQWSDVAMILPRENEYPDPTVFALGVGGAVAGARPTVQIKDDLISVEAANSEVVMQGAIDWHIVSRALMDEYEKDTGLEALEIIIGTRWSVYDLYSYIEDNDPSVQCETRSIVEDGESIWPERFPATRVDQLRREFGAMFYLLYMNSVGDPELVDFDMEMVREHHLIKDGTALEFKDSAQDGFLVKKLKEKGSAVDQMPSLRGMQLNKETWGLVFAGVEKGRGEFFKYREGPVRLRG